MIFDTAGAVAVDKMFGYMGDVADEDVVTLNCAFGAAVTDKMCIRDRERALANVVIMPDVSGFSATNYTKIVPLTQRGYDAAEAHKAELLPYALSDAQWQIYVAQRAAKIHGPVGTVLSVKVKAPKPEVQDVVERSFVTLLDQPVDTKRIESLLSEVRSDGRYDADYTVGYDQQQPDRPILLVTVTDKPTGPPFLDVGFNLAAQTGGVTRASVNMILLYQDLGGYGSELRVKADIGFLSRVEAEYYWKLDRAGFFLAPQMCIRDSGHTAGTDVPDEGQREGDHAERRCGGLWREQACSGVGQHDYQSHAG